MAEFMDENREAQAEEGDEDVPEIGEEVHVEHGTLNTEH